MSKTGKNQLIKSTYFILAIILTAIGIVVKYFLVDTDLGARFKNFNHRLLASDLIFICAFILCLVGLIFYAIRKNKKSRLKKVTVTISAIFILPLAALLSITPILETIYPGKVGDNALVPYIMGLTLLAMLGTLVWIVFILVVFLIQAFYLFKKEVNTKE
jgi:cbb3-type cytochrome oxidase subunit 3